MASGSSKHELKELMSEHGHVRIANDMASIFSDLGKEWGDVDEVIGTSLLESAAKISEAACDINEVDISYACRNVAEVEVIDPVAQQLAVVQTLRAKYDSHAKYLNSIGLIRKIMLALKDDATFLHHFKSSISLEKELTKAVALLKSIRERQNEKKDKK